MINENSIDDTVTKSVSPSRTAPIVYFLTLVAQVSVFCEGYEMGSTSGAILLVEHDPNMNLNSFWREVIITGAMPSAAICCLIAGWFCDRFGRKKCVMFSSLCFTLGAIITASAHDKEVLLVGRLLIGSGIGFACATSAVYIAECAPSHIRGCLVSMCQPFLTMGILLGTIIAALFSYDKKHGWRYIWGILGVFSSIQFVAFIFLPESPRWFIQQSRIDEAKKSLMQIRKTENVNEELKEIEESFKEEKESIENSDEQKALSEVMEENPTSQTTVAISKESDDADNSDACNTFTDYYTNRMTKKQYKCRKGNLFLRMLKTGSVRRALMLGCGLQLFAQFSGVNTIIYFSGTIIQMAGVGNVTNAIWDSVMVNCVSLVFSIVGVWLVDTVGRRKLAIIGLGGLAFSSLCLGTTFLMADKYSPWINATGDLINSTCSTYSRCNECIKDEVCGFCYADNPNITDSCLPVSPISPQLSEVGACNSSLALATYSTKWAPNYCPISFSWVAVVGLALFLIFFATGMGPLPWTVNAEIYPLWARSTGNGLGSMTCWFCNLIIAASFLPFIELIQSYGVFYVMASVALIGSVFCFLFQPETKNKPLEEIEVLFSTKESKNLDIKATYFSTGD